MTRFRTSPRSRRRLGGFTLIEALVAIAVLGIIITIAYGAIVQGLRIQSTQEAATSSQARLRRITEVFTQELRSAVLGAVSDTPYASDGTAVSFTLLDGGAGYQITQIDVAGNSVTAVAASASDLAGSGDQVMLVDAGGQAVIFTLAATPTSAGSSRYQVSPSGSDCFAGMSAYSGVGNRNALLFKVKTLGISYDDGSNTLMLTEGGASERPLAFEISDLVIQYVYREVNSGDLHVEAGPLREDGNPARNAAIGGEPVELVRLQVALASQGRALGGDVTRNYLSQVELAANPSFSIKAVATCN